MRKDNKQKQKQKHDVANEEGASDEKSKTEHAIQTRNTDTLQTISAMVML